MKKLPRAIRNRALLALALAPGPLPAAVPPTEWQHRQTINVPAAGLARLAPPAGTFDVAQMSLADLRILDPNGQEVPYLLERDLSLRGPERAPAFAPKSFRSVTNGDLT